MVRYNKREFRMLAACIVAYTAAYLCRTNLSPTLDTLQHYFGLTAAQAGMLPTLFAIPYAAGQIINGMLADRFRPHIYMCVGLMGSALMNILFSLSASYEMLLVIWFLNGCIQSMIWTPVVRIFATEFRDETRSRGMFHISLTLVIGHVCAWAVSGLLTSYVSWQVAFRTTGLIAAVLTAGSCFVLRDSCSGAPAQPKAEAAPAPQVENAPISRILLGTDLIFMLLCCLFNGYVRDSVLNWAPKILVDTQGIDLSGAVGVALIIPLVNFIGIRGGQIVFNRRNGDVYSSIIIMTLAGVAFAALLTFVYEVNVFVCAALLALSSAIANGLNPLLASILPMNYRHLGRVALIAGLIDAMIYAGSAFSGTFAGLLKDLFGWNAVFASWAIFSLAGVLMVLLAIRKQKKNA